MVTAARETAFVLSDLASNAFAYGLALQSDGKIVAVGQIYDLNSSEYDFALVRYNADGTLDTSFDESGVTGDGKVIVEFGGHRDVAYDVVIQPDGKIVAAGSGGDGGDFAVAQAQCQWYARWHVWQHRPGAH